MAWSTSNRRSRLPADWTAIRRRVLRRDGHTCQVRDPLSGRVCGEVASEVDHIRAGDNHAESNLRAICTWHHSKKSSSEGGRASAAAERGRKQAVRNKFPITDDYRRSL